MKNKFSNKTVGTIIIASMLCAMLTAGCAKADNADSNTETTVVTAYELSENPEFNGSEVSIEGKANYGETYARSLAEVANDESAWWNDGCKVFCEEIKDIISISAQYADSDDILGEKVTIKLPYEKGMYILTSENGIAYDIPAEYIDGKYVFKTNKLGDFVISTVSTGKKKPVKTKKVELAQQTIKDESTGVKVSGMLPVGAKIKVDLYCMDDTESSDVLDWASSFEDLYPKTSELSEYAVIYNKETSIEEMISYEGWGEEEFVSYGGKIAGSIKFIKDFEVLDFESDIEVILPFDYHHALEISEIHSSPGDATAIQYDYDKREFVTLEVVPEKETEKDTFQFNMKSPGDFFLGGDLRIDSFTSQYISLNENQ